MAESEFNDDDLDLGEEEALPMARVRASMAGTFNTGVELQSGQEFITDLESAKGWHVMGFVEMIDPMFEDAKAATE